MKLLKLATMMIIITFFCKAIGFIREIILASILGVSLNTDAYLLASTFPNTIFSVVTIGLSTTFIPSYLTIKENYGDDRALTFTNTIINILILFGIVFTIVGILSTHKILSIVAVGFDEETLKLTIKLTKIMFPSIIFLSVMSIFRGFLQSNDNFLIPTIRTIPYNIILIISILFSNGKVEVIAIGTLLAVIGRFILEIPFVLKQGYKYIPVIELKDKYLIGIFKSIIPTIIGLSVFKINILIDRSIASTLETGSISALSFSNRIVDVILDFMVVSIGAISYKKLSEVFIKNKNDFKKILNKSISLSVIFLIPITMIFITFSENITRILFQRGKFIEIDTIMTSQSLTFYSLSIVGFGINDILIKAFFSIKNNKIPMANGIGTLILNVILNLILIKYLSYKGIALATSITSIISVIFLFSMLSHKLNLKFNKEILLITKVLVISIILSIISKRIFMYLISINIQEVLSLMVTLVISVILYLVLWVLFNIKDIKNYLINIVRW